MPEYSAEEAKWHVDVVSWLKGGIIGTAGTALKFAELVLETTESTESAERQRPLTVIDQGDTWRIEGSWNRDGNESFGGPWRMVCKKHDAQILDIGSPAIVKLSPDIQRSVEEAKRLKREIDERKRT